MIKLNSKIKFKKGFTLIELLVVISIIALLSSVVLSSLNKAQTKARDSARIQEIKQLKTALSLYADDHNGIYPNSTPIGSWGTYFDNYTNITGDSTDSLFKNALSPIYIKTLPTPGIYKKSPYKNSADGSRIMYRRLTTYNLQGCNNSGNCYVIAFFPEGKTVFNNSTDWQNGVIYFLSTNKVDKGMLNIAPLYK